MSTSQGYQEQVQENHDHSKHSTTTTVITGQQSHDRADEYVPQGLLQGEVMDHANRNKSFVLDFETCERQRRRVFPDGTIDTTVKQHVKVKHFDEGHDVEVDGNDDEGLSFGILAFIHGSSSVLLVLQYEWRYTVQKKYMHQSMYMYICSSSYGLNQIDAKVDR